MGKKVQYEKDKTVGQVKESLGKALDDNKLELEGKIQTMKGNMGSKMEDIKDSILEKTNDILDNMKKK